MTWILESKKEKGLLYLLTHLSPRVCLDLGELELGVVGVHLSDLLPGRSAEDLQRGRSHRRDSGVSSPPPGGSSLASVPGGGERVKTENDTSSDFLLGQKEQSRRYLDDFHQLVHSAVAGEDGLPEQQLGQHAAG